MTTYMAVVAKDKVCISWFAEIIRDLRQPLYLLPGCRPVRCGAAAHEQCSEVLGCPCETQEIAWVE